MTEAICPACGSQMPDSDPRRRWCSARCRRRVSKAGGALRLARRLETFAEAWDDLEATSMGPRSSRGADLRERAARLRQVSSQTRQ